MNDLLKSIKEDLLDRRLAPLVGFALVALLAAVVYAVVGGGSGGGSTGTTPPVAPASAGIPVSQAQPGSGRAVAETTTGSSSGHHGAAHDPFAALPGSQSSASASTSTATATSSSKATAAGESASAGSGSGSGSKASTPPSTSNKSSGTGSTTPRLFAPSKPAKPKTVYKVALQFGVLPPGTPPQNAELTSYAALTKATPLPSAKEKLIEFVGVTHTSSGTSASFSVTGEVILHGEASCLPSPSQCQVIDVKAGKTEQLEYLSPTGTLVTYELRVVSITSASASAAAVAKIARVDARAASRLFVVGGAFALSGLRFSSQTGVLVFGSHGASTARAHAAVQHAAAAGR